MFMFICMHLCRYHVDTRCTDHGIRNKNNKGILTSRKTKSGSTMLAEVQFKR